MTANTDAHEAAKMVHSDCPTVANIFVGKAGLSMELMCGMCWQIVSVWLR